MQTEMKKRRRTAMKRNYFALIMPAMFSVLTFISCTEVETCPDRPHPHYSSVKYEFIWDDDGYEKPDSMYVIAYRVVNRWKCSMVVDAQTGNGHYLFNAYTGKPIIPETDTPEGGGTSGGEDLPPMARAAGSEGIDIFNIRTGDYKFAVFNMDEEEFIFEDVDEYITSDDPDKHLQDLYVQYKSLDRDDPNLHGVVKGWVDYNPYAKFIQPDVHPIYVDSLTTHYVHREGVRLCQFHPKRLTQDIDIYFNIKKINDGTPFKIDSVRAEMAGIPHRINLANGYFDITQTRKMMFSPKMSTLEGALIPDGENEYDFNTIRCHKMLSVPAIVHNNSENLVTGPGIMQVMIFLTAIDENGEERHKKIQGKINLYNTLAAAELVKFSDDGLYATRTRQHTVLDIKVDIEMNGSSIIENADNGSGLDIWIQTESDDLNFDI